MLDTPAPTAPQELLDRVDVTVEHGLIVKYDSTVAELATLTHKYGSAVFDCTQPEQDKQARAARKELVATRAALEAKRKELKDPHLAICKEIDQKAAFLKSALVALEDPIDAQIKIEEDRKEALKLEAARIEFERVAAIKAKIAVISRVRIDALRMSGPQIEAALSAEFEFTDFAEFEAEARAAYEETCAALQNMLQVRMQQEEEQAALKKAQDAVIAQAAENLRVAEAAKAKLDAEMAEQRAAMAAEKAEQEKQQAAFNAVLEAERVTLNAQLAEIKAKADDEAAKAQAAERQKNMASEIAKARLCSAAPMMLAALKAVHESWLPAEVHNQVLEAIVAAEGGAL